MSASETKHAGLNLGGTDAKTHAEAEHAIFGFWIFLMSDAVIFALLFATYGVMLPATAGRCSEIWMPGTDVAIAVVSPPLA